MEAVASQYRISAVASKKATYSKSIRLATPA